MSLLAELALPLLSLACAAAGWLYLRQKKKEAGREDKRKPRKAKAHRKLQRATNRRKAPDHKTPRQKETGQAQAPDSLGPALLLQLAAAMLRAGKTSAGMTEELARIVRNPEETQALEDTARALQHGLDWTAAWQYAEENGNPIPPSLHPLRHCLENLAQSGAPTAGLLDIVAERHRRYQQREAEKRASQLSVKLVLPLGLCSLPAFICWGIMPVMIALLPGLNSTS